MSVIEPCRRTKISARNYLSAVLPGLACGRDPFKCNDGFYGIPPEPPELIEYVRPRFRL
jgi:hypothetical protein